MPKVPVSVAGAIWKTLAGFRGVADVGLTFTCDPICLGRKHRKKRGRNHCLCSVGTRHQYSNQTLKTPVVYLPRKHQPPEQLGNEHTERTTLEPSGSGLSPAPNNFWGQVLE